MEDREKIILETLRNIPKQNTILIGGYAVNAYVPPRFSIDCDLVVIGNTAKIETTLKTNGFVKTEFGDVPHGGYMRYLREKEKVSFDFLINSVLDRETGVVFEGELFRKHSKKRITVGRANPIRIDMVIADPELLFAMKFVSARRQDIRDLFMLAAEQLKWGLVSEIILKKCDKELTKRRTFSITHSVQSKSYRDSLHGPYGKMPDERFDLCKKRLTEFLDGLSVTG